MSIEELAEQFYSVYRDRMGGPLWHEFASDPACHMHVVAWRAVAARAITVLITPAHILAPDAGTH